MCTWGLDRTIGFIAESEYISWDRTLLFDIMIYNNIIMLSFTNLRPTLRHRRRILLEWISNRIINTYSSLWSGYFDKFSGILSSIVNS